LKFFYHQVRDEIVFTLFDEVVEDDRELGGISEGEASERVERRFIGSFSLPFSTVFREGRIEGTAPSSLPCLPYPILCCLTSPAFPVLTPLFCFPYPALYSIFVHMCVMVFRMRYGTEYDVAFNAIQCIVQCCAILSCAAQIRALLRAYTS
jgi:hypothetical protein